MSRLNSSFLKGRITYLEVSNAYRRSSIWSLICESGYKTAVIVGGVVYLLLATLIFIVTNKLVIDTIVVLCFSFYTIATCIRTKMLNSRVLKLIGTPYKPFLNDNKLYWVGVRSLLFCRYLHETGVIHISDNIDHLITNRFELRKINLFESKIFTVCCSILLLFLSRIIEILFNECNLTALYAFVILGSLMTFIIMQFTSLFRNEQNKMSELKFFIDVYNDFGKDLMNELKKNNKKFQLR